MTRCSSCSAEIPEDNRFCGACGAAAQDLTPTSAPTAVMPAHVLSPSSGSIDEGRFPAGTLLAGRYRVIALAGRGGMGEVYRANDLKLGQAVALKFLSGRGAISERALDRFHNEVRIARQVSHPNVCRVYDIGEAEGMVYLSMEYVDGEDLGSLLRRIGRLSPDKATEIARRICAGLAAAHDKGVLHRDLKPGNVMIDGRGQVLITDFGLAGVAGQVEGAEVRNGTPGYMAPEQLAGKEVSVKSDLYALGVVLYEMFTGKRAFEDADRNNMPSGISELVKDADPAVERIIQRCLDTDPRNRPSSALAVAAALPGGDPLAAALAAGETPSPELVAAAGDKEAIPVRLAAACMAVILLGLIVVVVLGDKASLLRKTPFEKSPEELAAKSRDLIHRFGYTDRRADFAFGFTIETLFLRYAQNHERPETFRAQLGTGQPPPIFFWYRQSPFEIDSPYPDGVVSEFKPGEDLPGMVDLNLDTEGRLYYLLVNPPWVDDPPETPPPPADWSALFAAAGLDLARFSPAKPQVTMARAFDTRMAWTGSYAHMPEILLRVDAASWKGKPVFFWVYGPWVNLSDFMLNFQPTAQQRVFSWFWVAGAIVIFGMAAWLAARNLRLGRGDTRGAFRLALFALGCSLAEWVCNANHHAGISEYGQFTRAFGAALFSACAFGVLYLALEPYVRRRLPRTLISWTRILGGGVRDPLVGGHVLIGLAAGTLVGILFYAENLLVEPYGSVQYGPNSLWLAWVLDARRAAGTLVSSTTFAIGLGLTILFVYFLARLALRKDWLAAVVIVALFSALYALRSAHVVPAALFMIVVLGCSLFVLVRFGVLSMISCVFTSATLATCPMTTDFSAWYSWSALFVLAVTVALAAWCFRTALAGRRLWRAGFLED